MRQERVFGLEIAGMNGLQKRFFTTFVRYPPGSLFCQSTNTLTFRFHELAAVVLLHDGVKFLLASGFCHGN